MVILGNWLLASFLAISDPRLGGGDKILYFLVYTADSLSQIFVISLFSRAEKINEIMTFLKGNEKKSQ